MKVVETAPQRLTLSHRAVLAGVILAAGILACAGIGLARWAEGSDADAGNMALLCVILAVLFAIFVRQEVAIFDRVSREAILRTATVFGWRERKVPLAHIAAAVTALDPSDAGSNDPRLMRVELKLVDGTRLPLSPAYRAGPGPADAVAAINAWLDRET